MNIKSGKPVAAACAAVIALAGAGFAVAPGSADPGRSSVPPPPQCHAFWCGFGNGDGNGNVFGQFPFWFLNAPGQSGGAFPGFPGFPDSPIIRVVLGLFLSGGHNN